MAEKGRYDIKSDSATVERMAEGREPGTILIGVGILIAALCLIAMAYQFITRTPCSDSELAEGSCVFWLPFSALALCGIGIAIAVIGYVIRSRHRKKTQFDALTGQE